MEIVAENLSILSLLKKKKKLFFLYKEKYFDCNIRHFSELLADREGIKRDASTLLRLLKEYDILSVKAHRKTKKVLKKKLLKKKFLGIFL